MRWMLWMLRGLSRGANRCGVLLSALGLFALTVLTTYAVVARYIFQRPSVHAYEVSVYLLLLITWLSVGWVMRLDRHVNMQALTVRFGERGKRISGVISYLTVLLFCGVLIWSGTVNVFSAWDRDYRSSSLLAFPLWLPYALIPVGACLLAVSVLEKLFSSGAQTVDADKPE